jgi:hypothetical protein
MTGSKPTLEAAMVNLNCPWCEEQLLLELEPVADEQTCPACLTTWSYVEEQQSALPAAA